MRARSLYGRIGIAFALSLLGFGGFFAWLSFDTAARHQHEVLQRLNQQLATQIVAHNTLADAAGLRKDSVDALFHMLMAVNPNIEVYLLDTQGKVVAYSPTEDPVVQPQVALAPLQHYLAGGALPIIDDDPRQAGRRCIFSAAPVRVDGRLAGYVYIVLLSSRYQHLIEQMQNQYVLHTTLWIGGGVLLLALLAGLAAFALITRRLDRLTVEVEQFEHQNFDDGLAARAAPEPDEIGRLAGAFERLKQRLRQQMAELRRQDSLRREMVANVSHDLRTPLTSMQGCLETLQRVGGGLNAAQQQQYLEVAVRQSRQVARLAQQLFELAQLELEETLPHSEPFSISELMQDVAQKFAPAAERAGVRLALSVDPDAPFVRGDIGLIERVITNFADNALRHTPRGGQVQLDARRHGDGVEVQVADTGCGIAAEHLRSLFRRDSPLRQGGRRRSGGLGLLIAHRILTLHGIAVAVDSQPGQGSRFGFVMPVDEPLREAPREALRTPPAPALVR